MHNSVSAQILSPHRRRFGMTPDDALENVAFARAHNTDQQLELLKQGAMMLCDTRFSLLIVDRCGGWPQAMTPCCGLSCGVSF